MLETYVIFSNADGIISAGQLDREWDAVHPDGSTTTEAVARIMASYPGSKVRYVPVSTRLPNNQTHKVQGTNIVERTPAEKVEAQKEKRKQLAEGQLTKLKAELVVAEENNYQRVANRLRKRIRYFEQILERID